MKKISDGLYVEDTPNGRVLNVAVSEVLRSRGLADTPDNRRKFVEQARQTLPELVPGLLVSVSVRLAEES